MRGFALGLAVSVAYIVGCATAQLVIPPATAQVTQRWGYLCIEEYGADDVTEVANRAGAEGWEIVGVGGTGINQIWCFKRSAP
jgi:hypothetical protein